MFSATDGCYLSAQVTFLVASSLASKLDSSSASLTSTYQSPRGDKFDTHRGSKVVGNLRQPRIPRSGISFQFFPNIKAH